MKLKDNNIIGGVLYITRLKDNRVIEKIGPIHNKFISSDGYGRNLLMQHLFGTTTYPLEIDSMAIGDNNTAPVDGDTALGNSLVSGITLTDKTLSNDTINFDIFVAAATLPDDTYEEIGFFANSRLMSRIIISPAYTKAAGEDTLFTYSLTLSG